MSNSLGFVVERPGRRPVTVPVEAPVVSETTPVDWVRRTARISLAAQVVFGLFSLTGFAKLENSNDLLNTVLILDVCVQFVEFMFYFVFVVYKEFDVAYRYIDWFVTTPTMLLSLIMFLRYDAERDTSVADFFDADETAIHLPIILACNAIMLAFGLLSEIKVLPTGPSNAVGFVFLIGAFVSAYVGYVGTGMGRALWAFTFVVWFLYGVAAYYDQRTKAIAYNCLDVVSKNLYGVFITIYMWI